MFTIIGADSNEYGPVSATVVSEWIAAGRANLQTKARREGESEWKTLGDFAEFNGPPVLGANEPVTAPLAGPVPTPSASPATPHAASAIAAQLAGRAANFDFLSCLARSFELWKAHLLPLAGVTFLSLFIQMAANFIPLLGALSGLLLGGVFTGGLYYYYLGTMRGEPREVSDIFAGFSKALGPLILTHLLIAALLLLVMLPFFGPIFFAMFGMMLREATSPGTLPMLGGLAVISLLVGLIPLCYLSVSWVFAVALVIDQGLGPWTALEVSRRVVARCWFRVFALAVCATLLALLGLIGLFIGIIFTLPLLFGSLLYAYEDLCRPPAPPNRSAAA